MTLKNFNDCIVSELELQIVLAVNAERDYFLQGYSLGDESPHEEYRWIKNGKIRGVIAFSFDQNEKAVSLPFCPFGGFFIESFFGFDQFIKDVETALKSRGIRSVQITQAPFPYESKADLINNIFFKNGYQIHSIHTHQILFGRKEIKKAFRDQADRLLKKAGENQLKLHYGKILNFSFLQEIELWNSQKGYPMTWDANRLIDQVSLFPERYFQISITSGEVSLAHAVAVKLTSNTVYYFLSAFDSKSQFKNLGELLVLGLLKLAKDEKVDSVDFGSSESEGHINDSLMFFKSRFSNDISNKITWEKTF